MVHRVRARARRSRTTPARRAAPTGRCSVGSSDITCSWLLCSLRPATMRLAASRQLTTIPICSSGTPRMWYVCVGSKVNSPSSARWRFQRSNTDCGTAPCASRRKPDLVSERSRAKASSVAAPIAMWSGCPKMPSGPNVTTTAGSSSSRICATAETTSSNGTSATPPSGRPSHSCRSGTRPSARQAASSSAFRTDPSVSRVAGNPSRMSPCSPYVAWIRTNLKSGSSAWRATLPATP